MTAPRRRATNILITCSSDESVGGVSVVCQDLVRMLEKNGRRVHLVYAAPASRLRLTHGTNSWGRHAYFCPMPVIVRGGTWFSVLVFVLYFPISLFHLARVVRRNDIDVIDCHYLSPYFVHLVAVARLLHRRIVISVHGSDVTSYASADWLHRLVCRTILRHADAVVACSDALARETSAIVPQGHEKVVCIHNAFDPSRCSQPQEPPVLPEPFLLFVGRHVAVKGIDTLLRAYASIADDAPDLSLVLVGDGPLLNAHRQLAATLGVAHRVHFVGEVSPADVGTFLSKCVVFILPSRAEAFGLVLLEAGYYGKPIVCTRVGGTTEVISDGVNGVVVEPDDPVDLGRQILALLRDPERAARLSLEAHRMVTARFLWQDRIADCIAVYEGARRPGAGAEAQERQVDSGDHRVKSGIKSVI